MDLFDNMIWAYRAVFKQTDVGGGSILANFTMNERTVILYGIIGLNDYAADRVIDVSVKDSAGNFITRVMYPSPIDNELVPLIHSSSAVVIINTTGEFHIKLLIGKGEVLTVRVLALAQNEELTVNLRALVSSVFPSISTTGSDGTVTITETYNKVI